MNQKIIKDLALFEELETSIKLVKLGLGEIQNLDSENRFYHLPFQLLSSGFERLMKCHICLGHNEAHGEYPDKNLFKNKLKHDLIKIKKHIVENYFKCNNITALERDLEFLSDEELNHLIGLLSEFGKFARYHNLDIVTDVSSDVIDVKALWNEYEMKLLLRNQNLLEGIADFEKQKEISDAINLEIVQKLERFTRVFSRQFTIGGLGALALQYSHVVSDFYGLRDEDLGETNYREVTNSYKMKVRTCKRRVIDRIRSKFDSNYVNTKINKHEFDGEWPFYVDEITIECRYKIWCVVIINNCEYALNGAAKGKYKIDNVHDGGMAILGKSIAPFIKIALGLAGR